MLMIYHSKEKSVKKYLKFTTMGVMVRSNPSDKTKCDLRAKFDSETITIFTDISNNEIYGKEIKHTWTTIKSVEKNCKLTFLFYFDDSVNARTKEICNLGLVSVEDEFDLRSISNGALFLIKIICLDSDPSYLFYIFSIKHIVNEKSVKKLNVNFDPIINGDKSLLKNYDYSNSMLQNINDTIKVFLVNISALQESKFSYTSWIYFTNVGSDGSLHYIASDIKINILQHKYYFYNFSNTHFEIQLLIHCEIHNSENEILRPKCTARQGNTFCDTNGKEMCLNPSMRDPPNCQTRSDYNSNSLCTNGSIRTSIKTSSNKDLYIRCECLENYIGATCKFPKPCSPCDIDCSKRIRNTSGYFSNCLKRDWCRNGTLAHNEKNFYCQCPEGYFGKFCEINSKIFCDINTHYSFFRGNLICNKPSNDYGPKTELISATIIILVILLIVACFIIHDRIARKIKRAKMGEITFNFDQLNELMDLKNNTE